MDPRAPGRDVDETHDAGQAATGTGAGTGAGAPMAGAVGTGEATVATVRLKVSRLLASTGSGTTRAVASAAVVRSVPGAAAGLTAMTIGSRSDAPAARCPRRT